VILITFQWYQKSGRECHRSKLAGKKFDVEILNLSKLSEKDIKRQYQLKISKGLQLRRTLMIAKI
jgi:hypothetical protein